MSATPARPSSSIVAEPLLTLSGRIMFERLSGVLPENGTGPLCGGSSHKRWITASDVVAFNFFHRKTSIRPATWCIGDGTIDLRPVVRTCVSLRDYQKRAVAAVMATPDLFRSGEVEIGCGLGKTFVGGELIRRSRAPAVVVTQHQLSVDQWISHLKEKVSLSNVVTSNVSWKSGDPLPDAVVTTYQTIVRVATDMSELRRCLESGRCFKDESHRVIWALHSLKFGLLVLDEVHMGVADQFRMVSHLNCSAVVGLSGSMVREDDRLLRMQHLVGPKLFRHHSDRTMRYLVMPVPISPELRAVLGTRNKRCVFERALLALNPAKICALHELLRKHASDKLIVFCDSRRAATILHNFLPSSFLLHGGILDDERRDVVERFSCLDGRAILISTRVCEAAIDFPSGCVIVQLFSSCGSRQQEVQRAGRGSRGDGATGCDVVHIVNLGTDEVEYAKRRIDHMRELCSVDLTERHYDSSWEDLVYDKGHQPLKCLMSSREAVDPITNAKKRALSE